MKQLLSSSWKQMHHFPTWYSGDKAGMQRHGWHVLSHVRHVLNDLDIPRFGIYM